MFSFITDHGVEKYLKRLMGKKDVDDALERLDMLTKEENLMMAARNLEVSHHVDVNVKAIQEVTHRVDDKVTRIEQVIYDVDGNVKATKEFTHHVHANVKRGAQHSFRVFIHVTDLCFTSNQRWMTCNVRYSLTFPSPIVVAKAFSQGIGCEKSFKHGSLPQILPLIIIQRATRTMTELQRGSSKAASSTSGRITDRYYGSVAIVCLSPSRVNLL